MGTELLPVAVALVVGLLSIPICYCYTLLCELLSPVEKLGLAMAILSAVLVISVLLTRGRIKNKMYYGKVILQ
jgi:xanthine/uracil permease